MKTNSASSHRDINGKLAARALLFPYLDAMTTKRFWLVAAATLCPAAAFAQNGAAVRDEMMRHFEESMSKFISLAAAIPADKYTWKPSEPAMPVGHVYAHVARYNYWYLTNEMKLPA